MKARKILEKARSGSKNIRFADFIKLIEAHGFILKRISGSHHVFAHPRVPHNVAAVPDKNAQARNYQIRQFLALVTKYELSLDDSAGDDK